MPAGTLATIAPFKVVLPGKDPVAFGGKIEITFLNRNNLLHMNTDDSDVSVV